MILLMLFVINILSNSLRKEATLANSLCEKLMNNHIDMEKVFIDSKQVEHIVIDSTHSYELTVSRQLNSIADLANRSPLFIAETVTGKDSSYTKVFYDQYSGGVLDGILQFSKAKGDTTSFLNYCQKQVKLGAAQKHEVSEKNAPQFCAEYSKVLHVVSKNYLM